MMQVCIFAYGQTGSGKTHTMLGNPDIPDEGGVIPRSLEQVFQTSQSLSAQGWSFRMQVCNPEYIAFSKLIPSDFTWCVSN